MDLTKFYGDKASWRETKVATNLSKIFYLAAVSRMERLRELEGGVGILPEYAGWDLAVSAYLPKKKEATPEEKEAEKNKNLRDVMIKKKDETTDVIMEYPGKAPYKKYCKPSGAINHGFTALFAAYCHECYNFFTKNGNTFGKHADGIIELVCKTYDSESEVPPIVKPIYESQHLVQDTEGIITDSSITSAVEQVLINVMLSAFVDRSKNAAVTKECINSLVKNFVKFIDCLGHIQGTIVFDRYVPMSEKSVITLLRVCNLHIGNDKGFDVEIMEYIRQYTETNKPKPKPKGKSEDKEEDEDDESDHGSDDEDSGSAKTTPVKTKPVPPKAKATSTAAAAATDEPAPVPKKKAASKKAAAKPTVAKVEEAAADEPEAAPAPAPTPVKKAASKKAAAKPAAKVEEAAEEAAPAPAPIKKAASKKAAAKPAAPAADDDDVAAAVKKPKAPKPAKPAPPPPEDDDDIDSAVNDQEHYNE
jgi:hypothetical protein